MPGFSPQRDSRASLRATRTAVSGASGTPRKNESDANAIRPAHAAISGDQGQPGLGTAWIAGLVWGVLALASDNYLYLSALLLPLFWPRLRNFGAFLVGVLLVVSPITLRNYGLTGELIPISAHGGEAVYIANNPRTDGLYNPLYNGFQKLTGHEQQRQKAEKSKVEWNSPQHYNGAIVTEIAPASEFYKAEVYHQDFFNKNPSNAYCRINILPKFKKLGLLRESD